MFQRRRDSGGDKNHRHNYDSIEIFAKYFVLHFALVALSHATPYAGHYFNTIIINNAIILRDLDKSSVIKTDMGKWRQVLRLIDV